MALLAACAEPTAEPTAEPPPAAPRVDPLPAAPFDSDIVYFGSSAANLWALRDQKQLMRFDGTGWVDVPSPERVPLTGYFAPLEQPCATPNGTVYVSNRYAVFRGDASGVLEKIAEGHANGSIVGSLETVGEQLFVHWWKLVNLFPAQSWYGDDTIERFDGTNWVTLADPPGLVGRWFDPVSETRAWAVIQVKPYEAQVAHLFQLRDDAWVDYGVVEPSLPSVFLRNSVYRSEDGWWLRQGGLENYGMGGSWQSSPTTLSHAADGAMADLSVPFPHEGVGNRRCLPVTLGLWERGGKPGLVYSNYDCFAGSNDLDLYFQELSDSGGEALSPWATLVGWDTDQRNPGGLPFRLSDGSAVLTSGPLEQHSPVWVLP